MNSNNEKIKIRWTSKEIICGKLLYVIILTIIFSNILINQANIAFNIVGQRVEYSLSTYRLGIISILFVIPAFYFSVLILKVITNINAVNIENVHNAEVIALHKRKTKFKWHRIYSVVIGYILIIVMNMLYHYMANVQMVLPRSSIVSFLIGIACLAIPIILVNLINRLMIKVTETNTELLAELVNGSHDAEIPEKYMTEKDFFSIVKIIQNAEAHSIYGAIWVYKFKLIIYKICKYQVIIGFVIGGILALITMGSTNYFISEMEANIRGFNGNSGAKYNNNNENKSQKWVKANQARDKASLINIKQTKQKNIMLILTMLIENRILPMPPGKKQIDLIEKNINRKIQYDIGW